MSWSAIQYKSYNSGKENIFALNGALRKRIEDSIVYEWGISAPAIRPSLSVVSGGGLTGTYNAKYTYARKERNTVIAESNPSDEAVSTQAVAGEYLKVTFTEPSDIQVNCIRIYRTITLGSTYYFDQDYNYANGDYGATHQWEIDDGYISGHGYLWTSLNETDLSDDCFSWEIFRNDFTITDPQRRVTSAGDNFNYVNTNTTDANLGSEPSEDHDRPPEGSFVVGPTFNGVCLISYQNRLYYSKPKQPEYWPLSNYVDVSPPQWPGLAIVLFDKQPYYLTKQKIYYVYFDGTYWTPKAVASKTGTQSARGALAVEGYGIFHVGSDGVYVCLPSTDSRSGKDEKLTGAFNRIFHGETINGIPAVGDLSKSWLVQFKDRILFGFPGTSDTYPTNILVFYMTENRVAYHTRSTEIRAVGVDYTNERLLAGDENGNVWVIEDETATDDDGTAITWEVESKDFTPQTRLFFPRWAKYDVDASDGLTSCTAGIYLDGTLKQSHTITGARQTKRRLITTCNGNRCSMRISGYGPVKIYAAELE